jgi:hypothetical protein
MTTTQNTTTTTTTTDAANLLAGDIVRLDSYNGPVETVVGVNPGTYETSITFASGRYETFNNDAPIRTVA